jgi:hypothetical protein
VTPVFKALQPVLEVVGKALKVIIDSITQVLSTIGGAVRKVTDFVGLTTPSSRRRWGRAGTGRLEVEPPPG